FDDPLNTISQLPQLMNPSGIVIIEVDLKTHTPKLREIDPLNIYRVPAFWYDAFSYAGVPNRVRPEQYLEAFELAGFSNVKVVPISILSEQSVLAAKPGLSSDFKGAKYDMSILSVYIIASIAARESSG
ncbi:MAG: hypothetical protein KDD53_05130, partial [Bdellovibrionales bacterium]|nr:hypothetical protein [Bdellovibrionales bacterium]